MLPRLRATSSCCSTDRGSASLGILSVYRLVVPVKADEWHNCPVGGTVRRVLKALSLPEGQVSL